MMKDKIGSLITHRNETICKESIYGGDACLKQWSHQNVMYLHETHERSVPLVP